MSAGGRWRTVLGAFWYPIIWRGGPMKVISSAMKMETSSGMVRTTLAARLDVPSSGSAAASTVGKRQVARGLVNRVSSTKVVEEMRPAATSRSFT
eukprot:CAMPEP_0202921518 /NCGR_PEP_ID=MMETSP1392-20130828/77434_1 /ASSEMBLY_ACC=CAM_ASM_000868 /TAXON_ID=225041 /ORGANISM="Chlamydomonas chlamydogama, Strain SAG 11-48b" /LENGTH=94 /DNA_ID=CAMNT_0049615091 /DNA_START=1386 /DNA_END=1673 /DNA_ORIENTATION=-